MSDTQFDYYYGSEGDQFSFIRIPKLMLLDPKFQALSLKSIILYGFLLDRMNLSMRRGWLDEDNRVYIRFRIKEIMEDMNVCEKTAIGYLAELEKIGLVEKDKKGMGMGNKLYVKNFISPDLRSKAFITSKKYSNGEDESMSKNRNSAENVDNFKNSEVCKASKINITVKNGGNGTVDIYSNETVETDGYGAVSFSGDDTVKSYSQSNTEYINNKYINNKGSDNESNPINRHMNYSHMQYMLSCLKNNCTKVGNIKGYLKATVFNAPATIDSYYQAEVNYDMSHPVQSNNNERAYDFDELEKMVLSN